MTISKPNRIGLNEKRQVWAQQQSVIIIIFDLLCVAARRDLRIRIPVTHCIQRHVFLLTGQARITLLNMISLTAFEGKSLRIPRILSSFPELLNTLNMFS